MHRFETEFFIIQMMLKASVHRQFENARRCVGYSGREPHRIEKGGTKSQMLVSTGRKYIYTHRSAQITLFTRINYIKGRLGFCTRFAFRNVRPSYTIKDAAGGSSLVVYI